MRVLPWLLLSVATFIVSAHVPRGTDAETELTYDGEISEDENSECPLS